MLQEAYRASERMGSTTMLLTVLDNSTMIHGKLHPMVAVLSIGDCEMLMLRRVHGRQAALECVFHTEMQRIGGDAQTPLQLARVDGRIDPDFDEGLANEVIEHGSAVHCVTTCEGDILVLGSDGVFDNLFLEEVARICNEMLPPRQSKDFQPTSTELLSCIAERIVQEAHAKCRPTPQGDPTTWLMQAPIGVGGKMDDTSVVIAEVTEWLPTANHEVRRHRGTRSGGKSPSPVHCSIVPSCRPAPGRGHCDDSDEYEDVDYANRQEEKSDMSESESKDDVDDRCFAQ